MIQYDFDFNTIHLTKREKRALIRFRWKNRQILPEDIYEAFEGLDLVECDRIETEDIFEYKYTEDCHLTRKGTLFLEYYLRENTYFRLREFRAWVTLAIAFVALLASLTSIAVSIALNSQC